jgi:NAD(P)-dependent dehydrogenase (short-subunit alcohol dehydrogenase family)
VPEDVAPTAVFLASEASNYYAGQTLCPNGGDVML